MFLFLPIWVWTLIVGIFTGMVGLWIFLFPPRTSLAGRNLRLRLIIGTQMESAAAIAILNALNTAPSHPQYPWLLGLVLFLFILEIGLIFLFMETLNPGLFSQYFIYLWMDFMWWRRPKRK